MHLSTRWMNVWQQGEGNQPPTGKQRGSGRLLLPDRWPLRRSPLVGWVCNNPEQGCPFVAAVLNLSSEHYLCNVLLCGTKLGHPVGRLTSSHCCGETLVQWGSHDEWYVLSLHAAYENLQSRQETRDSAWQKDGWDSTVYYTGRRMETSLTSLHSKMILWLWLCIVIVTIFNTVYSTWQHSL